jgi:hypothetical protein
MRLLLGPDEPLVRELEAASHRHTGGVLWLAVAWARESGVLWLRDALGGRMAQVHAVVGVNERGTTVEALLRLMDLCTSVHVFYKHPRQTFHTKIYEVTGGDAGPEVATIIVGSSNLTHGGLVTNFEASLVAAGADVLGAAAGLVTSEFASELTSHQDVQALYDEGLVPLERRLRRERRERGGRTAAQPSGRPTAPPPPIRPPTAPPVAIPFPIAPDEPTEVPEDADPVGVDPLPGRFYVRTLTGNDVDKLLGHQTGTFEPDLGEMARDQFPAFWGWPDRYDTVVRQLPRDEWAATGRLTSSAAPGGVDVEVMLWYREERPGHAAEHRVRLGPVGQVRAAVPVGFDVNGVLVVTRAPDGAGRDFDLRLIAVGEADHAAYAAHLTVARPAHRFGYGP